MFIFFSLQKRVNLLLRLGVATGFLLLVPQLSIHNHEKDLFFLENNVWFELPVTKVTLA